MDVEKRNRIRAALFAYAYEIENMPLTTDSEFDRICLSIDPSISTDSGEMDNFFKTEFTPYTGMWVHRHPQLKGIRRLFERITQSPAKAASPKIEKSNGPKINTRDITGHNSHSMNMLYLKCLGFSTVSGEHRHFFKEYGIEMEWNEETGGVVLKQENLTKFLTYEDAGKVFFGM